VQLFPALEMTLHEIPTKTYSLKQNTHELRILGRVERNNPCLLYKHPPDQY